MSEYESDRMPEYRIPGRMSECMSDRVPGYMSDRMPEYMSDRMPEYRIPGRMSGCMSEYMATSSRISENISNSCSNRRHDMSWWASHKAKQFFTVMISFDVGFVAMVRFRIAA